jgi:hypothetical protein
MQITLPDDLAAQIGKVTDDPSTFVVSAVRHVLDEAVVVSGHEQVEQINRVSEELNREAEDVLEYQVIP